MIKKIGIVIGVVSLAGCSLMPGNDTPEIAPAVTPVVATPAPALDPDGYCVAELDRAEKTFGQEVKNQLLVSYIKSTSAYSYIDKQSSRLYGLMPAPYNTNFMSMVKSTYSDTFDKACTQSRTVKQATGYAADATVDYIGEVAKMLVNR